MPATVHTSLPQRAAEVLRLVHEGHTAQEIAEQLDTSRNAVYQQIGKLRKQGHLPDREPAHNPEQPVEQTIESFIRTLERKLQEIDARGAQLEQELERLRNERDQVVQHITKLRA